MNDTTIAIYAIALNERATCRASLPPAPRLMSC